MSHTNDPFLNFLIMIKLRVSATYLVRLQCEMSYRRHTQYCDTPLYCFFLQHDWTVLQLRD